MQNTNTDPIGESVSRAANTSQKSIPSDHPNSKGSRAVRPCTKLRKWRRAGGSWRILANGGEQSEWGSNDQGFKNHHHLLWGSNLTSWTSSLITAKSYKSQPPGRIRFGENLFLQLTNQVCSFEIHIHVRIKFNGACLADKRTSAWLKLKKDYVIGLSDSLDLVPIGAWHGNGRKARWVPDYPSMMMTL